MRQAIIILAFSVSLSAQEHNHLNIANPEQHPYVDPAGNREGHLNTEREVNEARVYDFYQRQADYYMAEERKPALIPAFPGLDAGQHGHWGKHSQNQHQDGRWNGIDMGSIWGQKIRSGKLALGKAVSVKLGSKSELSTCFDPETLSYPSLWQGGFIQFDPFRWGTSRNVSQVGEIWFDIEAATPAWNGKGESIPFQYNGYYRHGERAIFTYHLDGGLVFDSPSAKVVEGSPVFVRSLQFREDFNGGELTLGILPDGLSVAVLVDGEIALAEVKRIDGVSVVSVPRIDSMSTVTIAIGRSALAVQKGVSAASRTDLVALTRGGPLQWPQSLTVAGSTASDESLPYVVDTIVIPEETGFQSVMQLTSLGFLEDGTALVATLAGEMWAVSGLTRDLSRITWKRFAAGLHQPIGIHIDEDGIFVMERGQITRLHDLNGDGEADFYETYANDFLGREKSHTHSFGLARDKEGAFYFANWKDIYRTGPDRVTEYFAYGVRNCMGVGVGADGSILFGPQEGTDTPASMVIELHEGEFYGHKGDQVSDLISPPLCYIPRGVDNSTGGFIHANDSRWGPMHGHTIGLSYGYSTHYLVLKDRSTNRHQGAIVPLEGDFKSGVMRGAMGPHDGQLYLTGIDGWGDYSVSDGCLQRVRYTGQPFRQPIGFQVHSNGIRIEFPIALDPEESTPLSNFFVQQWNYEYAPQYGSPEFSKKEPQSLGHDVLAPRSVKVLNDGHSLFVEIPEIEPVMQMHVRMHLKDSEGISFKTDLFPTILELGEHFRSPGLAPPREGKQTEIVLRVRQPKGDPSIDTMSGEVVEGERTIALDCSGALQFDTKLIEARINEPIKLVFKNSDIMPHNAIFVTEGNLRKVGELAFSMLNDPKALNKNYTPDVPEVIAGTFVVPPGGSHTLHFTAPAVAGDHHFVCTFPGHWMTMNGVFRVTE